MEEIYEIAMGRIARHNSNWRWGFELDPAKTAFCYLALRAGILSESGR
jgi:hypothetical protein